MLYKDSRTDRLVSKVYTVVKELNTKEKILRTAAQLFSERGYFGVSMEEIASRVGIGKSALYYHFESKISILEILLDGAYAELKNDLNTAVEKSVLPSDCLFNIVLAILDFRLTRPEITLLNTFGLSSDSKIPALQFVTNLRTEFLKFVRDLLKGTNLFKTFTYKVLQIIVINLLSFTLNPFLEIKENNKLVAEKFCSLFTTPDNKLVGN